MSNKRGGFQSLADLQKAHRTDAHADSRPAPAGTVYSTASGKTCPECGQVIADCKCGKAEVRGSGKITVQRETKGRKGKGVTVIRGVPLAGRELEALARALRQHCGVGGTCKPEGIIELQGDQIDKVRAWLAQHPVTAQD